MVFFFAIIIIIRDFGVTMKIQELNYHSQPQFGGKIPVGNKKAIKSFTTDYLKKQDGYVSSNGSIYNGIAITMRGTSGTFLTGWLIYEFPKMIGNDLIATVAQIATGLGSLAVAMSRLENDKVATGQALVKVKPFVRKLKEAGFSKSDEMVYGIKQFMNKKGGFFTSIIPNGFSSKKAANILKDSKIAEVK